MRRVRALYSAVVFLIGTALLLGLVSWPIAMSLKVPMSRKSGFLFQVT